MARLQKNFLPKKLIEGVILPGMVNANSRLETAYLQTRLTRNIGLFPVLHKMFPPVITVTAETRRINTAEAVQKAWKTGTFFFNDIITDPEMAEFLRGASYFTGNRFLELHGFKPPADQNSIDAAKIAMGNDPMLLPCVNSVFRSSPNTMTFVREKARFTTLSIDLLTAPDEWDLPYERGDVFDYLKKSGFYMRHRELFHNNILPYLHSVGMLSFKKLFLVNLLHANKREMDFLNEIVPHTAWVLCHRMNEFMGYTRRNWALMEHTPLKMLIGTGSPALAGDCSVLNEISEIHKLGIIKPERLLQAATYSAFEYMEIHPSRIPYFIFPDAHPEIESLIESGKAHVLRG